MKTRMRSMILGLVLGLATGVAHADITSGLLGYWALDGNANDSSGNGYHGVEYESPSYVSGIVGPAMEFDGPGQSVYIEGLELLNQDAVTICMWVKADRDTPGRGDDVQTMWFSDEVHVDQGGTGWGRVRLRIRDSEWQWAHGAGPVDKNPHADSPVVIGAVDPFGGCKTKQWLP